MMQKTVLWCVAIWTAGAAMPAQAENNPISIGITADFFGKYVWRGQNLNDAAVFQPGVSASWAGLTGSVWGNLDLTDENDNRHEFTEYDFTLSYSAAVPGIDGVGFTVGAIQYVFPSVGNDTLEAFWGFSFDLPLAPSITVYHDVDEANGTYASFGLSHTIEKLFELSPDLPVGMTLSTAIGWGDDGFNEYYWGVDDSKFTDLTVKAAFPMTMWGWTVSPNVSYVHLISKTIRRADTYDTKSDYVFAGVNISKTF